MHTLGSVHTLREAVSNAFALVACLGIAACATRASTSTPQKIDGALDSAVIAVVTDLVGTTAPCGCTSRPLGGLDHLAALVEARAKTAPLGLVVAGNTLFPEANPAPAMQGFVRQTGLTILDILQALKPMGLALGDVDARLIAQDFLGARAHEMPILHSYPIKRLGRPLPDAPKTTLAQLGGVKIGLITAVAASKPIARPALLQAGPSVSDTIGSAAEALRQDGAELVVLAWPSGVRSARTELIEGAGVDIIVAGSDGAPSAPQTLGQATLIDGGARGEHVGVVHLHKNEGGRFVLFDGGQAQRQEAQAKRTRYLAEAQALPPGAAQKARQARADALIEAAEQDATQPPTTAYFTVEMVPMDAHLPKAAWATKMLQSFNQSLCAIAERDTAQRHCLPAPNENAVYVGSSTCQACHAEAYAVWQQQAHAHAFKTLEDAGKQCDLSCIGCHVVGYEQPGGFCKLVDAPMWANVGCEDCHGPGSGHARAPGDKSQWATTFVRDTPEATCRGCHNAQHSDQFNFATYRPRVLGPGHGLASANTPLF